MPTSKSSGMERPQSSRMRSEEHTSELQSRLHLVCRLLLENKKANTARRTHQGSKVAHIQTSEMRLNQLSSYGLVINVSVHSGASSPLALHAAVRNSPRGLK